MISNIISLFKQQARQHKTIKSFHYNRIYEQGSGNESHPLLWLEDPIWGKNQDNLFVNTVNFAVLFAPTQSDCIEQLQNIAFSTGLNIIERIKRNKNSSISILPNWTYVTLRDYYDNDSCGCRFTVNFNQLNMQNLCLIEEQFDENGELDSNIVLEHFGVGMQNSLEVYINKLPEFNLKTSKK